MARRRRKSKKSRLLSRRNATFLLAAGGLVLGSRVGCTMYQDATREAELASRAASLKRDYAKDELPYFGRFYGGYAFGHGVGNINLRATSELGVSNFFYAERTGVISHFRYQKRFGKGYSKGDLGRYTVRIVAADEQTKLPVAGGEIISNIDYYQPGVEAASGQRFQTVEFAKKGQVTAKRPYCLVWINTHPFPDDNYFAQNNDIQYQWVPPERPDDGGPQPGFWNPARIEINGVDKPWFPYPISAFEGRLHWGRCGPPLMEYRFEDGQWGGWGSWGSPYSVPGYLVTFDADKHIRERFRVTRASRTVKSVWLNLWRLNGGTGDLIVRLERGPNPLDEGNGEIIETVTVPARQIYDAGQAFERDNHQPGPDLVPWIEVPFTQEHELTVGQIYSLRLSTASGVMETTSGTRAEQQGLSQKNDDFIEHELNRSLSWLTFDDSMGLQESHNQGEDWGWSGNRHQMPCLFTCV